MKNCLKSNYLQAWLIQRRNSTLIVSQRRNCNIFLEVLIVSRTLEAQSRLVRNQKRLMPSEVRLIKAASLWYTQYSAIIVAASLRQPPWDIIIAVASWGEPGILEIEQPSQVLRNWMATLATLHLPIKFLLPGSQVPSIFARKYWKCKIQHLGWTKLLQLWKIICSQNLWSQ